jgi:hypothetical protein
MLDHDMGNDFDHAKIYCRALSESGVMWGQDFCWYIGNFAWLVVGGGSVFIPLCLSMVRGGLELVLGLWKGWEFKYWSM